MRNGDLAWREAKRQLRKDHRWELAESLDREEKERLFNEHIEQLSRKKRDKFRELLDEVGASTELTASWRDIKKLLKDDPRYLKFSSSDRVCNLIKNLNEYYICMYIIFIYCICRNVKKNLKSILKINLSQLKPILENFYKYVKNK